MPQDHPARGIHDVFHLKTQRRGRISNQDVLRKVSETHRNGWITGSAGWGSWNPEQTLNLVLRSQTTAVSARTLASGARHGKFFTIDRCFRPDVVDATHSFEFHQCEGIVAGEGMNLRHLLSYLEIFGKEIAGAKDVRFRPGYFPFTEPSVELDCLVNGKWVEMAGAGIFRPEVSLPLGVNVPVLAWGIGFGRLAMIKLGITDIRDLFSHDLEWLRNKKILYQG
jgi:phenylalanyl-tRNA synthetase alpha chain